MTYIHNNIYFTWEGWDLGNPLEIIHYNVEFIRDFGIFIKGEKFDKILITYNSGIMKAYNNEQEVKRQIFTLIVKDS